jgi:hypothetical protein
MERAVVGHDPTHSPHLMQSAELIFRWGSIPIGQERAHRPHSVHRSPRSRRPKKLTRLNNERSPPIGQR